MSPQRPPNNPFQRRAWKDQVLVRWGWPGGDNPNRVTLVVDREIRGKRETGGGNKSNEIFTEMSPTEQQTLIIPECYLRYDFGQNHGNRDALFRPYGTIGVAPRPLSSQAHDVMYLQQCLTSDIQPSVIGVVPCGRDISTNYNNVTLIINYKSSHTNEVDMFVEYSWGGSQFVNEEGNEYKCVFTVPPPGSHFITVRPITKECWMMNPTNGTDMIVRWGHGFVITKNVNVIHDFDGIPGTLTNIFEWVQGPTTYHLYEDQNCEQDKWTLNFKSVTH